MSVAHEMKLQPKFFDFIKYGTKRNGKRVRWMEEKIYKEEIKYEI